MNRDSQSDKPSTVVLSSHILHRALCLDDQNSWKSDYYVIDTLYLAILLEHFVLHDRILFNPETEIGYEAEELEDLQMPARLRSSALFAQFAESGVIDFHQDSFVAQSNEEYDIAHEMGLVDDEFDVDMYLLMDLRAIRFAFNRGLAYVPDYSRTCVSAMSLLEQQRAQQSSLLQQTYTDISGELQVAVQRLVDAGSDKKLFIPPIPAIILDRATSAEDICRRAIEVRDEFSDLRTTFKNYEAKVRDDSLSLGESLNALDELERAVNAACPRSSESLSTKVSEWRDLTDASKWLDGISTSESGGILKLAAGKPLQVAASKLQARRVSYLSKLCKQFFRITNYGTLVQRVLGHDITDAQIQRAKSKDDEAGLAEFLF